jgi:superfamily II DNA/RNA helicase
MVFLVTRENRHAVLVDLLGGLGRSLVFARTKHGATKLARDLSRAGVPATELHGNLSQSLRQRNLAAFSDGRVRVLVATDIAARGIHVDDIALVVHSDPPAEPKAFLHRSGRTARAGASGIVVTLCQQDQNRKVKAMMAAAGIGNARREVVAPGSPVIAEVRGELAPPQVYVPEPGVDHRFEPKHPRQPQGQRGGRPFGHARGATKARAQLGTGAWGKPARERTDTPKGNRGAR